MFLYSSSFARTKLIYDAEMDRLEAERIAKRDHQRGERPVPEADAA